MFWDLNALDLEALLHESGRPGLLPDISPVGYQVRAVELDINFLARTMVRGDPRLEPKLALGKVLRGLAEWSYQGRLESITLNARNKFREESGDSLGHQSFREILLLRRDGEPNGISGLPNPTAREMLYHEYLDVLCRAGGKNGYLSHLKRNLVIDTLPQHNEGCKISEGDPNEMLDELNLAWGGHLIMNQDISHRDGNRVKDVFMKRLTPKGRGGFYYSFDVELYLAAQCHTRRNNEDKRSAKEILLEFGTHSLLPDLIARYRHTDTFRALRSDMGFITV